MAAARESGVNTIFFGPEMADALLALCRRNLPLDTFTSDLVHRRVFGDPRFDHELSVGIVDEERLIGAAVGVVRAMPDGARHGWIKLLAVDTSHRRCGIGTMLLDELERRFRERGAVQIDTAGAPYYLWPGVDVRYTPACCLFERAGYTLRRCNVNMLVELDASLTDVAADPARLEREGVVLARADRETFPRVLEFIRGQWPLWAEEVPIAMANEPPSLFYAQRDGRVVGFAAYDAAMFDGTFGPTGTDPAVRGQGLGVLLLKACLADMKARGYERCEIAWVGPVGFYADKTGAIIHRVFREYHKPL